MCRVLKSDGLQAKRHVLRYDVGLTPCAQRGGGGKNLRMENGRFMNTTNVLRKKKKDPAQHTRDLQCVSEVVSFIKVQIGRSECKNPGGREKSEILCKCSENLNSCASVRI